MGGTTLHAGILAQWFEMLLLLLCLMIHYYGRQCDFIWCRERERNVLFNDALNTFYLRLYGVRHMVKDHSDSEKGNPLPPYNSKGSFIYTIPQTG